MSHISFPEVKSSTAQKIRAMIDQHQFVVLFDMYPENDNIGFHYMLADNASEDVLQQAATISAMLAGIFLLPDEQFMEVLDMANAALSTEAMDNPALKEHLEEILSDDPEEEKPEYLN